MKIKAVKINKTEYLMLFFLMIRTSFSASKIFNYPDIVDLLFYAVIILLAVVSFLRKIYSQRMLLIYISVICFSLVSVFLTREFSFFISVLLIFLFEQDEMDCVLSLMYKYYLYFLLFHTLFAVFLSMFYSLSIVGTTKSSYNFALGHPNTFSLYVFNVFLLWIWFNFRRIKVKHCFVFILLSCLLFYFTEADAVLISMFILVLFLLLLKIKRLSHGFVFVLRVFVKFAVPVLSFGSIWLAMLYLKGNSIVIILDSILSSRIRHSAYALDRYGLSFFGQNLEEAYTQTRWLSDWRISYLILDNLYVLLAINFGVVWIILLSIAFFKLANIADVKTLIILSVWILYSFVESYGKSVYLLFPLLLVCMLFSKKKRKNVNKQTNVIGIMLT